MQSTTSFSPYRRIGAGACGSVWARPDNPQAIKREDGHFERSVSNDFLMHRRVLDALRQANFNIPLLVPHCFDLILPNNSKWWAQHAPYFPPDKQMCKSLVSERIPPFPENVRRLLVEKYCPNALQTKILQSRENEDCIVRPYLGRRRMMGPSRFFMLRNMPLHIDQIEALGLDSRGYARSMAKALAAMHWIAGVDANDVEYVLAPPPTLTLDSRSPPSVIESEHLGQHTVWVLDFDCCRDLRMDEKGMDQATHAFYRNDPFYPRPEFEGYTEEDREMWGFFKAAFLEESEKILGEGEYSNLPGMLVEKLEEKGRLLRERKDRILDRGRSEAD